MKYAAVAYQFAIKVAPTRGAPSEACPVGPMSTHKRPSSMSCERPLSSEFETVRLFGRRANFAHLPRGGFPSLDSIEGSYPPVGRASPAVYSIPLWERLSGDIETGAPGFDPGRTALTQTVESRSSVSSAFGILTVTHRRRQQSIAFITRPTFASFRVHGRP
jgi:hypothetical protein